MNDAETRFDLAVTAIAWSLVGLLAVGIAIALLLFVGGCP